MSKRLYESKISATRIKEARKDKKMTQKQLAEKSGLSLITIKQYECEKRVPDEYGRKCLAQALNRPSQWFVGDIVKGVQNEN